MDMLGKLMGGEDTVDSLRFPEIMSDAAYVILTRDSKSYTRNFCIDEDILKEVGVTDFDKYAVKPGTPTSHRRFTDIPAPSCLELVTILDHFFVLFLLFFVTFLKRFRRICFHFQKFLWCHREVMFQRLWKILWVFLNRRTPYSILEYLLRDFEVSDEDS